jgi:multiple sugar transport system permease protein
MKHFKIWRKALTTLIVHCLLLAGAAAALIPFFWMISTSFKLPQEVLANSPTWLPSTATLRNYEYLFIYIPFLRQFLNTLFTTTVIVFGQLLFSSMAAYAFSRIDFPGRNTLFMLLLATMMVPNVVTLIPAFIIVRSLGWVNTYMALIGPYVLGSAFATFLLRQFMMTIPVELEEAAKIDGAGHFTIFWRIILPLVRPALAVVGIFAFVHFWNDFLWPLTVINSESLKVLTTGIAGLAFGVYGTDWGVLMAGSTLSVLPLIIVFLALQRRLIEGVAVTGLK